MFKHLQTKALLLLLALVGGGMTVSAEEVTDVLNLTLTGVTGTGYSEWSGKSSNSDAVYAGQCAGGNNAIQLRSKSSNSGIVSTTSGGKVKKVVVSWNSNTTSGRTLNVYGKNTAYSAATDLYNSSNQGTLLGTIVYGTSTELTIEGDYAFIGFRSSSDAMYLDEVKITWDNSTASLQTPTFEYSAAAFTAVMGNTNSFPTLNSNTDGAITYTSSKTDVATIDENGTITLVAAGTTTITAEASASDTYNGATASYELTVDDGTQATEVSIDFGMAFFGLAAQTSGNEKDVVTGSKSNVNVTYTRNDGSLYVSANQIRFYKSNELEFAAPTGYNIKSIVLTVSSAKEDVTANVGSIADYTTSATTITWTGNANSVTFTRPSGATSYMNITNAVITLGQASSVAAPVFSVETGNYDHPFDLTITAENAEEIWYTLDGTDPTAEGVTPITVTGTTATVHISETTTVTAVAIDSNAEASDPVTATYTLPVSVTSFEEILALADGTVFNAEIDAQVLYVYNNEMFLTDGNNAICFYNSAIEAEAGSLISGTFSATKSSNKNNPQVINFTSKTLDVIADEAPAATEIEVSAAADNLNNLVTFKGAEVTENNGKFYVGDVQVYDKFHLGYTLEAGTYDITGIVIVYNSTIEICPTVEPVAVVSLTATIGDAKWATYVAADNVSFPTGCSAYIATAINETSVTLIEVLAVAEGTPVVLNGEQGEYELEAVEEADCDDVTANMLRVVSADEAYTIKSGVYVLTRVGGTVGFYAYEGTNGLPEGRVYLQPETADQSRNFLSLGNSEATGIVLNNAENGMSTEVFDLQGRRVEKVQKGLYIVNGKKMIIK